jgi:hypothetical protein
VTGTAGGRGFNFLLAVQGLEGRGVQPVVSQP